VDIWFEGLSLPVVELDRSIAFYESLGFALEIRTERFGLLRYGTGTVGLLPTLTCSASANGFAARLPPASRTTATT